KGQIPHELMESYFKLRKEAAYTASRVDKNAAMERKRKEKRLGRLIRDFDNRQKKSKKRK
ncbi:MAG: hypothetical protein PHD74_06230, partial [Candidatus Krumholzibacteria bacterium]|nr:hypothetical protein [Candidatus Krumholzibacteria bacterium]